MFLFFRKYPFLEDYTITIGDEVLTILVTDFPSFFVFYVDRSLPSSSKITDSLQDTYSILDRRVDRDIL